MSNMKRLVEDFNYYFDNQHGDVVIAGMSFSPADILKEMDPIAYDVELSAFAYAMGYDEDTEDWDGQPTEQEEWASFDPDC